LQLGLPIDGEAVTGFISGDLVSACQHILGATPPQNVVLGNNTFQQLHEHATDHVVAQYA